MFRVKYLAICALVIGVLLSSSLLTSGLADGGANHQTRNQHFGVSGGNIEDATRTFCCSGTLGALVQANNVKYILSNNHVLARGDQASPGDDISQPGLIDNNCRPGTIVADFTAAPQLGSNVDAAIAQLRTGTMDATGFIEDIGVPSSTIVNPAVGLSVAKSGRTTGFTTGTVTSVNTSVSVQYQKNCGSGKKFTVTYTNQVVIGSGSFSAGGDSGSLIVTNNSSHNPVALLFAGSSSTTIANPIGEVLNRLSQLMGQTVSFVGGGGNVSTTLNNQSGLQPYLPGVRDLMQQLPQQAVDRAGAVLELHRANLMFQPGVIGAGVGASGRADGEAAIVIFMNKNARVRANLPDNLDGIPVTVVLTDEFVAY
jgi:hypothetical protein